MGLIMVGALASAAVALPTGPGGTLYFGGLATHTGAIHGTVIYRINVDSDWNRVDDDGNVLASGVVSTVCTINAEIDEGNSSGTTGFGSPEIWVNPSSDKMDMAGQYNNATLVLGAYYNNTPAAGDAGGLQGADLITVDARTLAVTVLNEGFGSSGAPDTGGFDHLVPVDSGWTPGGEALGMAVVCGGSDYTGTSGVWVDSDGNGTYEEGIARSTGYREVEYIAINSGYEVNGEVVTGAVIGHSYASTNAVYKTATGYVSVTSSDSTMDPTATIGSFDGVGVADTDQNGVPDVYWSSGDRDLVHATDLNNDGDWADDGEAWVMTGFTVPGGSSQGPFDMEVIACPNGKFVLLWYGHCHKWSSNDTLAVYAYELDEYGDILGEGLALGECNVDQGTGDLGMSEFETYGMELEFAPLGEAGSQAPEPATMLLVGTGMLSLAGVVRRRLLG